MSFYNLFLAILVASWGCISFAQMKVGDSASYYVLRSGLKYELTQTVIEVRNQNYKIEEKIRQPAQDKISQYWLHQDEVTSAESGESIVKNCAMFGGKRESVVVINKIIETCKIVDANYPSDYISYGAVPFGIVSAYLTHPTDGILAMTLSNFQPSIAVRSR